MQTHKIRKRRNGKSRWQLVVNIVSLVVFFTIWEIVADMNKVQAWFNPKFLPSPSDIVLCAVEYIQKGTLWEHTSISLFRILSGFGIGTGLAILVGIIFVNCKPVEAWFSPIINLLGPIPPYALLPIIIIWFGIGEGSKIGLIAYSTFMSILPYIIDGLRNTPPVLIRAASSLGATKMQIFTHVMIPNALPNLFVGMKVALAMTFGALMVAEMLGASKGLGFIIIDAKQWFKLDDMFLAIIIIGLLYIMMYYIITAIEHAVLRWKTDISTAIEK